MSFKCKIKIISVAITGLFLFSGCFDNPADPEAGKPRIIIEPQQVAVTFNDSLSFFVKVEGDAPLSYQWYHENATIVGAENRFLVIRNVKLSDSGSYHVVARNSKGEAKSTTVKLLVSGGEPLIGLQSVSDTVSIRSKVVLFVQAAGSLPFQYSWYKNDSLIATLDNDSFTIDMFNPSDSGIYRVIVSNSIGKDTSATFVLRITTSNLFISESDYQSGLLEKASTSDNMVSSSRLSIFSDAALKAFGGYLYILERFGADNIMKIDPSSSVQSGVVYQVHIGDNWNPQDIEFLSATKAYISNSNEPKITVFNPATGTVISHIDIKNYTFRPDSNSSPYANDLQLVGSDLYAMLQRRNGLKPGAPTLILKIDTQTNTVTDTIALQFKNGYAMAYSDGALYVSNPGSVYVVGDGAIEKVVLATKTVSTVIDEDTLGGNPNQIVHKSGSRFYVNNYISWKNVKVVEIDVTTGSIASTLPGVKDAFGGIFYDDIESKLYVGDRDSIEMGVRVYQNNIQVGSTIKSSNSLPPTSMVVVR